MCLLLIASVAWVPVLCQWRKPALTVQRCGGCGGRAVRTRLHGAARRRGASTSAARRSAGTARLFRATRRPPRARSTAAGAPSSRSPAHLGRDWDWAAQRFIGWLSPSRALGGVLTGLVCLVFFPRRSKDDSAARHMFLRPLERRGTDASGAMHILGASFRPPGPIRLAASVPTTLSCGLVGSALKFGSPPTKRGSTEPPVMRCASQEPKPQV